MVYDRRMKVVRHTDGKHTVVTPKGNVLTVPPGVIPPGAAYIDAVASSSSRST